MGKDLIIVESPAKVKTIKKFLGGSYFVESSVGHVRDLPPNKLGVDEDHDFAPEYHVLSGKEKVVEKLKAAADKAEKIYLAPDPDREGEAIAWHVAELIGGKNPNYHRIQFNEITSSAVKEALRHPRKLDERLFNSQQARRILDRLVGYKISPLLWEKVKRGISAGRVQTVALRLLVEREKERQAFVPKEYWVFKALLQSEKEQAFEAELWRVQGKKPNIGSEQEAKKLAGKIEKSDFIVQSVEEKEKFRQPKPPFITSSLQQEASNKLGFSAKKTMTLAQRLYEGLNIGERGITALITYMRTDSVHVAKEAREAAKEWIIHNLGKDYYPKKQRAYKSKSSAQEAHEAIRPVDVFISPEEVRPHLSKDLVSLYTLIWQRFLASQMASAKLWESTVYIKAENTSWRVKGQRIIFPGFMKVYSPEEALKETNLPKLQADQKLELKELKKEQKFTQPPPRYSEASLVRKLEELGIGRPSTYAQIISTLRERDYVRMEKRQFYPTELGITVNDLLVSHFDRFFDTGFTAAMEEKLDEVAAGKQDWKQLLHDFCEIFYPDLQKAEQNMRQVKTGMDSGLYCEECGRPMLIKFGKKGEFLACSGYPQCKNTSDFTRLKDGTIQKVNRQPQEKVRMGTCPQCGSDLVLKRARTGSRFIACSNYPKCKYTSPLGTGVSCPQENCPGELVEKSSKKGKVFYACDQYPDCSYALWNPPLQESCPQCGSKVLVRKSTKSRGLHLSCPEKGCSYWRQEESAAEDGNDQKPTSSP